VDFNKNKYEVALAQSAAKELVTSQFGNQLIFGKWFIGMLQKYGVVDHFPSSLKWIMNSIFLKMLI
jgi:hypothetical protein